jgi:hypothetical protein
VRVTEGIEADSPDDADHEIDQVTATDPGHLCGRSATAVR